MKMAFRTRLSLLHLLLLGALALLSCLVSVKGESPYKFYTWTVTYGVISPLGVPQQVILINGQFPGPKLDVVTNDNIILNLINNLDQPFLLTWNGIKQRKNSWQDGVLGTNCPIPPNSNFTYKFQTKDQIGTYNYFPSTAFHKAAGGFGAINIYARPRIPIPYPLPVADFTLLIGDWFKTNHKTLQQSLDSGKALPSPDGMLINGQTQTTFTGDQGKTYMLRISNVGLSSSFNIRIQGHTMQVVEVEGSHVLQNVYESLDVHVGQSLSVLVTLNQPSKDYYIVATTRFTTSKLSVTGLLRYSNSALPASGDMPSPPPEDLDWSLNQARSFRWNLTANSARPNPTSRFRQSHLKKMAFRVFLLLSLTALLIFSAVSPSLATSDVDDEDLSFLEDPKEESDPTKQLHSTDSELDQFNEAGEDEEEDPEMYEEGEDLSDLGNPDSDPFPAADVDEKDVVVIKERNFTDVIENNQYVMVEFYAPWCGHCQSLAPEYAAAATELKGDGVVLAKIDATEENELAHQYSVQGFPTILFFVDGEHKPYSGGRTKETIVTWVKKKIGPGVYNLTTLDDAEKVLTSGNKVVLGYLNSLVGVEHDQLAAASKADDDVNFYQTVNPDVAKMFHIDPESKRPALVLVKKEAEKISHFDGEFVKSDIASFVSANKLPLVSVFTRESAPEIFESAIKKQLLLFATQNESEKVLSEFEEAAKSFKGKLIFVSVDLDNEDYGKPVAEYFGVSGNGPKLIAYTGNEDPKKHFFDGEIKTDKIKAFGEEFLSDKLKPFYKSDPIPEKNDGDVKIVVGDNFDDIVLDESKDVLLEVYAPWCGHCQALEPMYNKLAKHLREIDSLVIAKMDGTTNEHPKAKAEGFPTILFFPAGNKTSEPITVDTDRTVVAFYKFLRKHATIPFKLEKPAASAESTKTESTPKVVTTETKGSPDITTTKSTESDLKDEL